MLNRRQFLRNAGFVAVVSSVPLIAVGDLISMPDWSFIGLLNGKWTKLELLGRRGNEVQAIYRMHTGKWDRLRLFYRGDCVADSAAQDWGCDFPLWVCAGSLTAIYNIPSGG